MIYHPTTLTSDEVAELTKFPGWSESKVQTNVALVGLIRRPARLDAPWLLYFPGNAMSLSTSQSVLRQFASHDWGLAVYAYRGYDGSGGSPTQAGLVADAEAIALQLSQDENVAPHRMFIMGQSLGSGVGTILAADMATHQHQPAGLILISAYTSMAQVFSDHVPFSGYTIADPYETDAALADSGCPVLLLHGDEDKVIGVEHSELKAVQLGMRGNFVKIAHRGHNDVWADPTAVRAVEAFVALRSASAHE